MPPPRLRVRVEGADHVFDPTGEVLIGRATEAQVRVAHRRMSRRHLILRPDGDRWLVEDAGSKNGSWRDGTRVRSFTLTGAASLVLGLPEDGLRVDLEPVAPRRPARPGRQRPSPPRPVSSPEDGLGAPSSVYQAGDVVTIGRSDDNDVVVPDLEVSRRHAELRRTREGRYEIVDVGSKHGTFLDGQRVQRAVVTDGSLIGIGHRLLRFTGGRLEEYVDTGAVTFDAVELTVRIDGHVLLDDVSFALEPNSVLAVLGPSGAGKTTLIRALTGFRPADAGTVRYSGRDLYGALDELRSRIGYVPQDDLLHEQLTPRQALGFAAELRFPSEVLPAERAGRIDEVLRELGIDQRASVPIHQLSGGQRKRTNVALELLTRPSVLFLDEPTSGLDPGFERAVMEQLRALADGGRTVVLITHSVQSLDLCDRVLFLAPGGKVAFFGPPDEALAYFQRQHYAEVFIDLERSDVDWQARFLGSDAHARHVERPLARRRKVGGGGGRLTVEHPPRTAAWHHQFLTLVRRYLAVITSDQRQTALMVLQAPVVGLIILFMFPGGQLAGPEFRTVRHAVFALFMLVFAATFMGANTAVREIVKELPIYRRERGVGMSASAYLASKAAVLGLLVLVQAALVVLVGTARQDGPVTAAALGTPLLELIVGVALAGLAAMAAMLLVSALVDTADKATLVLIFFMVPQLAFAGVFPIPDTPVVSQVSYVTSSSWGTAAAASTAHVQDALSEFGGCGRLPAIRDEIAREAAADGAAIYNLMGGEFFERVCSDRWRPDAGTWFQNALMLLVLTALALVAAYAALRRRDPKATARAGARPRGSGR